jgi:hypothetical protein
MLAEPLLIMWVGTRSTTRLVRSNVILTVHTVLTSIYDLGPLQPLLLNSVPDATYDSIQGVSGCLAVEGTRQEIIGKIQVEEMPRPNILFLPASALELQMASKKEIHTSIFTSSSPRWSRFCVCLDKIIIRQCKRKAISSSWAPFPANTTPTYTCDVHYRLCTTTDI